MPMADRFQGNPEAAAPDDPAGGELVFASVSTGPGDLASWAAVMAPTPPKGTATWMVESVFRGAHISRAKKERKGGG